MTYKKGTQVRAKSNITEDVVSAYGVPRYFASGTMIIAACDSQDSDNVYCRVIHVDDKDMQGWWLPKKFLERVNWCMFNRGIDV